MKKRKEQRRDERKSKRTYVSGGRCSTITWPTSRQLNRPTQAADFIRQFGIVSLNSGKPQVEVFGIRLRGHTPLDLVLDLVLELLYIVPQSRLALRKQVCGAIATVDVVGWAGRHSRMTMVVRGWSSRLLLALNWVRSVLETGQRIHS